MVVFSFFSFQILPPSQPLAHPHTHTPPQLHKHPPPRAHTHRHWQPQPLTTITFTSSGQKSTQPLTPPTCLNYQAMTETKHLKCWECLIEPLPHSLSLSLKTLLSWISPHLCNIKLLLFIYLSCYELVLHHSMLLYHAITTLIMSFFSWSWLPVLRPWVY